MRPQHAGLARRLSEDDVPGLRVHLPVAPAPRVEARHDNTEASGTKLVGRAQEASAEMARQPIQASGAGLDPGVGPGARDVVGRRTPERCSERLRRQPGQLDARGAAARTQVHPEGSRDRRQREPGDLQPLAAQIAEDSGRALAQLEGELHLEPPRPHIRSDGRRRQGRVQHVERDPRLRPATALRRPRDLAVGKLGTARHGSRETRDGSGEREVGRAPELAQAEPLVLERQRALDGPEVAEAGAQPPRRAIPRGKADLSAHARGLGLPGLRERGGKPRRQGREPPVPRQIEADRVALGPGDEPQREPGSLPAPQDHLAADLPLPLAKGRVEGHVLGRRAGRLDDAPGDGDVEHGGAPEKARQALTEPFESGRPARAAAAPDDGGARHEEPDRRGVPSSGGQERPRDLHGLGLHLDRPAAIRRQPKAPENDPGRAEIGDPIDLHAALEGLAQRDFEDARRPALIGEDQERDHGHRGQRQEDARHEGGQDAMAPDPVPNVPISSQTAGVGCVITAAGPVRTGGRRTSARSGGPPEPETDVRIGQYDFGSPRTRSAR